MTNISMASPVVDGVFGFNPTTKTIHTDHTQLRSTPATRMVVTQVTFSWLWWIVQPMYTTTDQCVGLLRAFDRYKLGSGFLRNAVTQLIRAIAFLHENGYTHGDINPSTISVHNTAKGVNFKLMSVVPTNIHRVEMCYQSPAQMASQTTTRAPSQTDDMWAFGLIVWFLLTGGIDIYTPVYSVIPTAPFMTIVHHTLLSFYNAIRDSDSVQYLQTRTGLSMSIPSNCIGVAHDKHYINASNTFLAFLSGTNGRFPSGSTEDFTDKLMLALIHGSLKCDPICRLNVEYVLDALVTSNSHLTELELELDATNGYSRLPAGLLT
jgi:serine/threonine protein kinase